MSWQAFGCVTVKVLSTKWTDCKKKKTKKKKQIRNAHQFSRGSGWTEGIMFNKRNLNVLEGKCSDEVKTVLTTQGSYNWYFISREKYFYALKMMTLTIKSWHALVIQ